MRLIHKIIISFRNNKMEPRLTQTDLIEILSSLLPMIKRSFFNIYVYFHKFDASFFMNDEFFYKTIFETNIADSVEAFYSTKWFQIIDYLVKYKLLFSYQICNFIKIDNLEKEIYNRW